MWTFWLEFGAVIVVGICAALCIDSVFEDRRPHDDDHWPDDRLIG